jgi:ATP-dependent Zn protease
MQAETEALITKYKTQIKYCAKRLYDEETLTGDDFRTLFAQEAEAIAEEKAEQEGAPNAQ